MKQYESYFYSTRNRDTRHAASAILDVVLPLLPRVSSVADVGCGVGVWLSVLREKGVETIQGFDGFWVEDEQLEIPVERLNRIDLEQPIEWPARYDLVMSLEVAEHLPPERASGFVEDLTKASDYVLFSAAIPRQGGYHHVNERWQSFWAGLFSNHGYSPMDCVRPRFWNDDSIPCWYSQNMLLYVKDGAPLQGRDKLPLGHRSSVRLAGQSQSGRFPLRPFSRKTGFPSQVFRQTVLSRRHYRKFYVSRTH